jgi:single stranded DNA-binding protein
MSREMEGFLQSAIAYGLMEEVNGKYRVSDLGAMLFDRPEEHEVSFLTVVVWGKQAESCREYLDKGSQVFVEGRLQTRTWDGKDGQQRTVTEVVGERVQFMGRTKGAVPVAPAVDDAPADDDEPPFLTTEEIPPEKRRSRHESRTARSCTSASDAPRREP